MKFTFYGHACFAVEIAGKKILFDPFISGNELAAAIDINAIQADYILVSHGHGDHIGDLISIAMRTQATVVAAAEIIDWVQDKGISKGHPMNFGGKWTFDFGTVRYVQAAHSSGLPDGTYGGNPGGFVITSSEGNFYYSGDTALMTDMQLLPLYATLDFAVLPVGGNFTMDTDDAVIASDFIKCNKIVGIHFDTFGYIKINHEEARKKFESKGKSLILPQIGATITI